ncbi:MAG: exopolysaccharide biosynthesis polyprenyl glycosylphosphotransferase [Phycisphaerales bacterium]|nr:exopolysaccharide biosynthesis polyprenyl glycosylphosphotransferase [Phycisphaerales bacterium]MDB5358204.1 exopolysaccharide biosynthesis polyprenyl glycosylphosphotransferase [Phycisphaerales bacterium]
MSSSENREQWLRHVSRRLEAAGCEVLMPAHGWYATCKAIIEWPIALLLCAVSLPIICVLAVLAKVSSPGPAFYRQVRLGRYGEQFGMYKIRTMVHNCEAATGPVWAASHDDPRVTRFGKFLRETHLDELPQLWHVLQGHMSLIGPRPERPEMAAKIERGLPRYCLRLQVRPGLTGLAQVHLPADTDIEEVGGKLAFDLYYARNLGPGMDLRICLCTVLHLTGLCLSGIGNLLVRSDGKAVEQYADQTMPMLSRSRGQLKMAARP